MTSSARPRQVLIAGGGVAGLEAAFALRQIAGDRVTVQILAPASEFVYRPTSVGEPFTFPTRDGSDGQPSANTASK